MYKILLCQWRGTASRLQIHPLLSCLWPLPAGPTEASSVEELAGHWKRCELCLQAPLCSSQQLLWHAGHPRCPPWWVSVAPPLWAAATSAPEDSFPAIQGPRPCPLWGGSDPSTGLTQQSVYSLPAGSVSVGVGAVAASCVCPSCILRVFWLLSR